MAVLTKQQAAPQTGPNMWPLFPLPVRIPSSGVTKKTLLQVKEAIQFGLMKSSCLLKQKLFPLFLRVRITLAPETTAVQPLVGDMAHMGSWAIHHQEPAHSTLRFQ